MIAFKKLALTMVVAGAAIAPFAANAADMAPAATPVTAKPAATASTHVAMNKPMAPTADFATMDADKDGSVSLKEFMKNSGLKESPAKIKKEFASLDKNKDKKLEPTEVSTTTVQ